MVKRPPLALLAVAAALLWSGPAPAQPAPAPPAARQPAPAQPAAAAKPSDDPLVARVDGIELHRSDIVQAQRTLPEQARQMPLEQIYPILLNQMVGGILLAEAGRREKLADDPEVKKRTAQIADQVIEEVYLARTVESALTDARLHQRYEQFIKAAPAKDEIHARHILVAKEEDAKAVIAELNKGADFATLAKQKSTDPAGKAGGDLGYFTREDMVPEFADAAFKLKPGQYTQTPVKTQFGWHVIKVEDRRSAPPPSFEDAREQLAEDLSREVIDDKIKELRAGAKVETFGLDGAPLPAGPTLLKP